MKIIDITGQKFGRLTALQRSRKNRHGAWKWLCQCSCGEQIEVVHPDLRNGAQFGVSFQCIYQIKSKRNWSHVENENN